MISIVCSGICNVVQHFFTVHFKLAHKGKVQLVYYIPCSLTVPSTQTSEAPITSRPVSSNPSVSPFAVSSRDRALDGDSRLGPVDVLCSAHLPAFLNLSRTPDADPLSIPVDLELQTPTPPSCQLGRRFRAQPYSPPLLAVLSLS